MLKRAGRLFHYTGSPEPADQRARRSARVARRLEKPASGRNWRWTACWLSAADRRCDVFNGMYRSKLLRSVQPDRIPGSAAAGRRNPRPADAGDFKPRFTRRHRRFAPAAHRNRHSTGRMPHARRKPGFDFDVVIVGASFAGAACALAAASAACAYACWNASATRRQAAHHRHHRQEAAEAPCCTACPRR